MTAPRPDAYLGIDLGAESGRAMVGVLRDGQVALHPVHRFANSPVSRAGGLYWDIESLWANVLESVRRGREWVDSHGARLRSVGVDTWGVDFALLSASGELACAPRCYRDPRHQPAYERILAEWGADSIYQATGIQFLALNTLYQLAAGQPEFTRAGAARLLFMPDLMHYRLTARMANEATIASTSQMVDVRTGQWIADWFVRLGLSPGLVAPTLPPATVLGSLSGPVAAATGAPADTQVILPASHDTASAVAAVPAGQEPSWCYISSGTWSLLGAEIASPCVTPATQAAGFTNERGVGNTIRFLKNLTGLWLVQECRREWEQSGQTFDYEQLAALARGAEPFRTVVDPCDGPFASPGGMVEKIRQFARRTGQPPPETPGQVVRGCLEGLALAYRRTLRELEAVLGARFAVIHVVGGGSRNALLNQLTADATGRPVIAGPSEATALGNVLIQAMGDGRVRDRFELRRIAAARPSWRASSRARQRSGTRRKRGWHDRPAAAAVRLIRSFAAGRSSDIS